MANTDLELRIASSAKTSVQVKLEKYKHARITAPLSMGFLPFREENNFAAPPLLQPTGFFESARGSGEDNNDIWTSDDDLNGLQVENNALYKVKLHFWMSDQKVTTPTMI